MASLDLETLVREMATLAREIGKNDGYMTFDEIRAKSGLSERRTRTTIKSGIAAGKLKAARVSRPNVAGELQSVIAYTVC